MLPSLRKIIRRKKIGLNLEYFLIGFAIVMFWRGSWWLMDHYFLPNNPFLSHTISIFIALIIFVANNGELDELVKH